MLNDVVCRLHYTCINTLKQERYGTKACGETSTDKKSVGNTHLNVLSLKLSVCQDKLPTICWLPRLHKILHKARYTLALALLHNSA